jgi:protein-S-isoprenylcysteine O-methyltransferase Ste14
MNTNLTIISFVFIIIIGRLFSSVHRKMNKKKSIKQIFLDPTAFVVSTIPIIAISLPIIEYCFFKDTVNPIISGIGALTVLSGFTISFFANKEIGENWSASIEKERSQKLITSGIYSYVRHPLYFSGIIIFIGTIFYFQSWWSIAVLFPCFLIINWRLKYEEENLILLFGNEYKEYIRKTKKIIPFLY